LSTNASRVPPSVLSRAFTWGRFVELVSPATWMSPERSMLTSQAFSSPEPPKSVARSSASPAGVRRAMKASIPPPWRGWMGRQVGKFAASVQPTTTARPLASTAMPSAQLRPLPLRYVE
jgi:hypothetical protein